MKMGAEGAYEAQAFYYDRNGHVVQKNSSGGMRGTRHETTRYSFTGNPVERLVAFNANVNGTRHALTEAFSYEYNTYTDQLVSLAHSINGSTPVVLASYTYDALGRTATKTVGGIETVNYGYNIRSWPTRIESAKFTELMGYNASVNGMTVSYPQWGGNIAAILWRHGNGEYRGYELDYDDHGRLANAWYGGGLTFASTDDSYEEYFNYDKMGNITYIQRNGKLDDGSYGTIDDLEMEYDGNQLTRVYDYASDDAPTFAGAMQFTDNADETTEYEYDQNGNMTKDLNSNITSIQYNYLNLPSTITAFQYHTYPLPRPHTTRRDFIMHYTYNADGEKIMVSEDPVVSLGLNAAGTATVTTSGGAAGVTGGVLSGIPDDSLVMGPVIVNPEFDLSTRYCGNVIFEKGKLKRLLTDEGYVTFASNGTPTYHYYLRDHLGNVRVVFNQTGTVEQRNDYYPSGALMATSTGGSVQPYKYNGKELERTAGLDLYDYGARWMDSKIGARFTTIDPMCEKYYSVSPYTYCHGNPANRIDPTGKDDYYSFTGKYLASDKKDSDHIMIVPFLYIPEDDYPLYSIPIENFDGSAYFYSAVFTDILQRNDFDTSKLRNEEISVYVLQPSSDNLPFSSKSQYNTAGPLHIEIGKNAPIGTAITDNNHITVSAVIHPLQTAERAYFSTVSNIISVLGIHEFTAHGLMRIPNQDHWKILKLQQAHPSWKTITPELRSLYQDHVKKRKEYQEPK